MIHHMPGYGGGRRRRREEGGVRRVMGEVGGRREE